METVQVVGVLVAAAAGLCMGSSAWTVKTLRRYQFEQWWFVGMLTGLVILPWTVTLAAFPNVWSAYRDVAPSAVSLPPTCSPSPGAWPTFSAACATSASAWP